MRDHRFKSYDPDQLLLMPEDLRSWLPENHLAWFVSDMVDGLDLSEIIAQYDHLKGGRPGFHPAMMVKLVMYAYCVGVPSSRQIEKKTYEDVAFRVLAAGYHPDHSAISKFRKRHLEELSYLFIEVLLVAEEMGLVRLGHVALDGTKVKANASKHKAMSYGRMEKRIRELKVEVDELLARAEKVDESEDRRYGKGKRGDELPTELQFRKSRIERIEAAKAALEADHLGKRRGSAQKDDDDPGMSSSDDDPASGKPDEKRQYNFTDPDSRIMRDGATKSFEQAYNAQVAVDCDSQVIVAAGVTQEPADTNQLIPLIEQIETNTGQVPDRALADAGYFSESNVRYCEESYTEPFLAHRRMKHSEQRPEGPRGRIPQSLTVAQRIGRKLATKEGRAIYSKRKESVEPVIGQIKHVRGFRQFLLRGIDRVKAEWRLICLGHNVLKMWRSGIGLPAPG
jgi:transposase